MVNSLQYLRFFAALGVAFFHAGPYAYADYSPEKEAQFWFSAARIGVDIFFIISGFVMYITEHGNDGGGWHGSMRFYAKRLIRVAPVYWMITVAWYFGGMYEPNTCGLGYSLLFIPETPAMNPPAAPFFCYPKIFTGWTLNYEMWFYLVFAASLLFGRWRIAVAAGLLCGPMLLAWWMMGEASMHPWHDPKYGVAWLSMIANPLLLDFLAGMVVGMVYQSRKSAVGEQFAKVSLVLACIWFFCIYVLGYFYGNRYGFAHYWFFGFGSYWTAHGMANAGLYCFVFVLLLAVHEKYRPVPLNGFFKKLADASYLMYLLHIIILSEVMTRLMFLRAHVFVFFVVYTLVVVASAVLLHVAIEAPLTRWLRRVVLPLVRRRMDARGAAVTAT